MKQAGSPVLKSKSAKEDNVDKVICVANKST